MRQLIAVVAAVVALASLTFPADVGESGDGADMAPSGCFCVGRVGNVNCDYRDEVTLGDISLLIDHFFISFCHLPNREEANCDGDSAGEITLGDLAALIDHMFISNRELPLCPGIINNPPQTHLVVLDPSRTYINGSFSAGPTAGIPVAWWADDRIDHPYYPPPVECEYRVYGPYSDIERAEVVSSFMVPVFEMNDGTLYRFGQNPPASFAVCDTVYVGGDREITCDTVLIDTLVGDNQYGSRKTLFDVEDPQFAGDSMYGHVAASSGTAEDPWTFDSSVVLFDLLSDRPADTTRVLNFIFWVRARDPVQSDLYDPTPIFATVRVIDPKFERSVLVVDWANTADENGPRKYDSAAVFWKNLVDYWADRQGAADLVPFDRARDYGRVSSGFTGEKLLKAAMSHRVLVLFQDAAVSSNWARVPSERLSVITAIQTGASAWLAARVPAGNYVAGTGPSETVFDTLMQRYFGAVSYKFTGWLYYSMLDGDRIEDFVGATPSSDFWGPLLSVDTAALHQHYRWDAVSYYEWRPEAAALPEVGSLQPRPEAEVWYRYVSRYGDTHPTHPELSLQGEPVMISLDGGTFRTVQSLFTPYALDVGTARELAADVLDWLYAPFLSKKPSPYRTEGAPQ